MRVVYTINGQDVLSFNRFVLLRRPRQVLGLLYFLVLPALVTFGVLANWLKIGSTSALAGAAGVFILTVVLGWVWYARNLLKRAAAVKGVLGEHVVVINEEGIRETTAGYDLLRPWHRVAQIVENPQYIYVFLDNIRGSQIPKRAFREESEARAFINAARSFWKGVRDGALPRADDIAWDADLRADRAPAPAPTPAPTTKQ